MHKRFAQPPVSCGGKYGIQQAASHAHVLHAFPPPSDFFRCVIKTQLQPRKVHLSLNIDALCAANTCVGLQLPLLSSLRWSFLRTTACINMKPPTVNSAVLLYTKYLLHRLSMAMKKLRRMARR